MGFHYLAADNAEPLMARLKISHHYSTRDYNGQDNHSCD
jgi:hypothetical protein